MENIVFKSPTKDDFKSVERVFIDVWNESILEDVFHKQLNSDEHLIICAYMNDEIVGAVSSFITISNTKQKRWEVDLIAVKKKCQGLGIGLGLLKETLKKAKEHDIVIARAVVRTDNTASQKIFKKAQFKCENITYSLQTWEPVYTNEKPLKIEKVTYIPVDTLCYRGIWIENIFDNDVHTKEIEQAINYAQYSAFIDKRSNIGIVIPEEHMNKMTKDILCVSKYYGKFNYWIYEM